MSEIAAIGVDEVACLIDFGIPTPIVLDHLAHLDRLRVMASASSETPVADHSIAAQIRRHRVTHLQCTPSMARMLLEDPHAKSALAYLKCWMMGGEALPMDLARSARKATVARLLDMYGPTETTVWSTTHELDTPSSLPKESESTVPIGRPISNTHVYVLDLRGQPVPIGAAGELYIAGDGVARGYLFRDALTEERFVPDPFGRIGMMYRTGDLARFRRDGVLEYLGRRDHQVKIRGHRVELPEIEAVIAEDASVSRCVVTVREDTPGDQRVVAYVVARGGRGRCGRLARNPAPSTSRVHGSLARGGARGASVHAQRQDRQEGTSAAAKSSSSARPGRACRAHERSGGCDRQALARSSGPRAHRRRRQLLRCRRTLAARRAFAPQAARSGGIGDADRSLSLPDHSFADPLPCRQRLVVVRAKGHRARIDPSRDEPAAPGEAGRGIGPRMSDKEVRDSDIAIVGMAARLPGARTPAEFWSNLEKGVESVRAFSDAELAAGGCIAR